ncbi:hypothetical protein D062_06337 [Streptococcus pneumoniae 1542]|nr:hypothetical protein D062_06337 [Streptococcus pneumoniae 1542]
MLLIQTNRSTIASRCELGFNLITQRKELQIVRLEASFIYIIRRLAVKEAVSPQLTGDRCQKEPRVVPNPRTGLVS